MTDVRALRVGPATVCCMEIRIATADDAAALTRLIWYVAGGAYADLGDDSQMAVWLEAHSTSELGHLIRAESGGCVLIAEGRRRPRGMIAIDYADATWPSSWAAWGDCRLEAFYVATPGRGIGGALLGEAVAICQEDGRERVFADLPIAARAARSLLEGKGFTQLERHPGVVFPDTQYTVLGRSLRPDPMPRTLT